MTKITQVYSLNFDRSKRKKSKIIYLVFHYTGMKSENLALKRLLNKSSKVSCHYFIKNNGSILNLVPDEYVSWHAGISSWKELKKINKYSIGIEIHNPGHRHGYKAFNQKQLDSIKYLSLKLATKYKIKKKNFLGHSDISPNRKKDPGEKFPWGLFSKYNIGIWHSIDKKLLKNFRSLKVKSYEKKIFFLYLKKIGYSFKKNDDNSTFFAIKAFQRRFRPQSINGKVDLECLKIAKNLVKSGFN